MRLAILILMAAVLGAQDKPAEDRPVLRRPSQDRTAQTTQDKPDQEKPTFGNRKKNGEWRETNAAPAAESATQLRVDSGTVIPVRLREEIKSAEAFAGRTYAASVDDDIRSASGAILVPKGADARVIIRDLKDDPKLTETARVTLDLESVTVAGVPHLLRTRDIERSGKESIGKNKRTGIMTGGGAALGAIIGGIAGGGKGAAIGVLAGAAAGGAAQVMTRDKNVTLPVETRFEFTVEEAYTEAATQK